MTLPNASFHPWTSTRKITFRFMAIYCAMFIFYTWLRFQTIPGLTQLHPYLWPVWRTVVEFFNDNIFHVRTTLVDPGSSTDTSFSWASQFTMLLVSILFASAWTVIDRKRNNYEVGEYWLRVAVRYFVAYFALYYGIIKLFALQMPFPSPSQLSTTLGDLSLTRMAWMFVGSSTSYQVFSGVIETAAGLFLMYRRTTTLGLILSVAVFGNVVALNMSYDIPVKLMSIHFFLLSLYLLLFESRRIVDFCMNRPTVPSNLYSVQFHTSKSKYGRIAAKVVFVYVAIIATIILSVRVYKSQHLQVDTGPIEQGLYDVEYFSFNGADSLRWKDFVLYGVTGSVNTTDTLFVQRYNRGYFSFEVDTVAHQLKLKRNYEDTNYITLLNYEIDARTLKLSGVIRNDSLVVVLKKSDKVYQLAKPDQFHWLQERSQ